MLGELTRVGLVSCSTKELVPRPTRTLMFGRWQCITPSGPSSVPMMSSLVADWGASAVAEAARSIPRASPSTLPSASRERQQIGQGAVLAIRRPSTVREPGVSYVYGISSTRDGAIAITVCTFVAFVNQYNRLLVFLVIVPLCLAELVGRGAGVLDRV